MYKVKYQTSSPAVLVLLVKLQTYYGQGCMLNSTAIFELLSKFARSEFARLEQLFFIKLILSSKTNLRET